MAKKSFRPRFMILPAILVYSLLLSAHALAQETISCDFSFGKYKELRKSPCGQREEAIKLGKEIIERYGNDKENVEVIEFIKKDIQKLEREDAACKTSDSLENFFQKFKTLRKEPCGKRAEAIRIGKRILELYANDPDNQEVIKYVRDQTARMEKDDESCNKPDPQFMPKPQRRIEMMARSKEFIASQGNTPLALDVMLSSVSIGYDVAVTDQNDAFNDETIAYARLAIERITAGQTSSSGKWGVFAPYKTKENALAWMNSIIGYILADRQNKKDEAIRYFYEAARFDSDIRRNGQIYHIIGKYHADRLFAERRKTEKAETSINLEGLAERALIAYAKGYKPAVGKGVEKQITDRMYAEIERLYRFRFKIPSKSEAAGLDDFIEKLAELPLPEFSAPLAPVFEAPVELQIQCNKAQ